MPAVVFCLSSATITMVMANIFEHIVELGEQVVTGFICQELDLYSLVPSPHPQVAHDTKPELEKRNCKAVYIGVMQ